MQTIIQYSKESNMWNRAEKKIYNIKQDKEKRMSFSWQAMIPF